MANYVFESKYSDDRIVVSEMYRNRSDDLIGEITVEGRTYPFRYQENADLEGERDGIALWEQVGHFTNDDGEEIRVSFLWEQQNDAGNVEDCCDWERPGWFTVDNVQYYLESFCEDREQPRQ